MSYRDLPNDGWGKPPTCGMFEASLWLAGGAMFIGGIGLAVWAWWPR